MGFFFIGLPEGDIVSQICSHLPDCIRVFAIKKATNGFNSKLACDGRTYVIMIGVRND